MMADAWYDDARNNLLGNGTHGNTDFDTDTIKVMLRDEGTTALNLTTQIDLADVSAARIGTDQTCTSATVGTAGTGAFDHALLTWTGVTGASVESLDYYEDSGVAGTSPLLMNIDSATGLPVTPNGGDITFDPSASGVVQIT